MEIFKPIRIKSIDFKNKIFVAPMCMYNANSGKVNDFHLAHYAKLALGGASLVMLEATAVSPQGRISLKDLGIWDDEHIEGLARITDFIHENSDAKVGIQIAHAGRKASMRPPNQGGNVLSIENGGWQVVAPSAIKYDENYSSVPVAIENLEEVKQTFKDATRRAEIAGFDVIEVHAAHGYLLHQFLSPISNRRQDNYGGKIENRMRFPLEVIKEMRIIWPNHLPFFVRISATDWLENGWDLKSSIIFSKMLESFGVDFIDVSSGGLSFEQKILPSEMYQVPFAQEIKKVVDVKVGAVGLIRNAENAEKIIKNKQADAISWGRPLLRNPNFVYEEAARLKQNEVLKNISVYFKRGWQ